MGHHGAQVLPMGPASIRASQGFLRRRWGLELGLASWEGPAWGLLAHLLPTVCTTDTRSTDDCWPRGRGDTFGTLTTTPITIPPTSVNTAVQSPPTASGASVNVTLAPQRGMEDVRPLGRALHQTSQLQFSVLVNQHSNVHRETSTWCATRN